MTNADRSMKEFEALDSETQAEMLRMIMKTKADGQARSAPWKDGDLYCYQHPGGGVAWGYNGGSKGFNVARGIWRPIDERK